MASATDRADTLAVTPHAEADLRHRFAIWADDPVNKPAIIDSFEHGFTTPDGRRWCGGAAVVRRFLWTWNGDPPPQPDAGVLSFAARLRPVSPIEYLPLLADRYDTGEVTATQLRLLLPWWTDAVLPPDFAPGRAVDLFRAAGFVTDAARVEPPTTPLTVYRGIRTGGTARAAGLSWTVTPRTAWTFALRAARRRGGDAAVYAAVAHPDAVLAVFHGLIETELVLDPTALPDDDLIGRVPAACLARPTDGDRTES